MKVLSETVGKGYSTGTGQVKAWTEIVLSHEKNAIAKREALDRLMTANAPPSPQKEVPSPAKPTSQPPFQPTRPRHQHNMSQPEVRSPEARREKTRSLMF